MASDIEPLLQKLPRCFTKNETEVVNDKLKSSYPTESDSFNQDDLYGALKKLSDIGAIDPPNGDTKILELMAEKTTRKQEVLETINKYTKPQEPASQSNRDFVGRDRDVKEILKLVKNPRVPGINLFGESGVGKTTLAKEVSKEMKDFESVIFIDLRDIKAIDNVYSIVLSNLNLPSWDNSKDRIFKHLQDLTTKTVVILDNIEQLLSVESQGELETRSEFLKFLKSIIVSEACKTGNFKMFLTSRIQINELTLKHSFFSEYEVKSFSKNDSKDFITRRVKDDILDNEQVDALVKISDLCHGMPYLLRGAEQLKRENYSSSVQVLKKITTQIEKGVPQKFACIGASFDSLPSDHLKQVAVKISLLRRPFSANTAMKIAELPSDYDAQWDLELLVIHKIITAEDVKGKRKYDLHALFREFVTLYLCVKEDSVYSEQLKRGEEQFSEHFSVKLSKLADMLEKEFVVTFRKLEKHRPNFEQVIDITTENETFDLLLHQDDLRKAGLVSIFFKYLLNNEKRKKLFEDWSESFRKKEYLLTSAYFKIWEALLTADLRGTSTGFNTLDQAKVLLDKAEGGTLDDKLWDTVNGMYLFCKGNLNFKSSCTLTDTSSKTKKMVKSLLHEALNDLDESSVIHRKVYGDHTLTARSIDLMGNCYMILNEPEKAEKFYQEAMEIKVKLVGGERHDEIVHYYNQLSQVHQMMGDKIKQGLLGALFWGRAKQQYQMAANFLRKGLELQEELGVCDTEDTATFQRNLANIYIALGRYDEAVEFAKKSYEIRQFLLGEHPETVRILYLIGIIHEWRKDHKAALQSYEEAFAMEESLPDGNHSVVRKLLCDRLEEMCKKLNKRDKLKEYRPRIKVIKEIKDDLLSHPASEGAAVHASIKPEQESHDGTEAAVEAKEEDYEASVTHDTEQGETEHPEESGLSGVPSPPEYATASHPEAGDTHDREAGIAENEYPFQSGLPGVSPENTSISHTEPEDTSVTHTELLTAETEITDEIDPQFITIDEKGGLLDIDIIGLRLHIPSDVVTQPTVVTCKVYNEESLPIPPTAGKGEASVSYIVGLEPRTVKLNKPITVSLMHSGVGKDYGYETVMKTFDHDTGTWEEQEETKNESDKSSYFRRDYVQAAISKLTILAIVSRLVTDRFEVTPEGCVVTSSVYDNVTVEFPEGAVDKTVKGAMKLLPMPKNFYKLYNVYACPILFISGFENIILLRTVTIQMLHPCPAQSSTDQVKLLRLKNDQWQEIEDPEIEMDNSFIRLHVQHFCGLWLMLKVAGTAAVALSAYKMYNYLSENPQVAFIAALRGEGQPPLQMMLSCLANHTQRNILDLQGKRYTLLNASTAEGLRPGDTALTKTEGSFYPRKEICLKFMKNQTCVKPLHLCRKQNQAGKSEQELRLLFYKKGEEELQLCEFYITIVEKKTDPEPGCYKPVEIFGILITDIDLRDLPEDVVPEMMEYFEDSDVPGEYKRKWRKRGREEFLRNVPRTSECLQQLLDVLDNPNWKSSVSHVSELLIKGQKLVKKGLKNEDRLKEEVIDIVKETLSCCWETLAGHLKIDEEILKTYRDEMSTDEQMITSKMLRQWIEKSDGICTLEQLFDALRLCGDKEAGTALAVFTTEKCKA